MPNISDSFRTLAIALLFLIGLFGWLLPMTLLLAPFGKHTEAMRHRLCGVPVGLPHAIFLERSWR